MQSLDRNIERQIEWDCVQLLNKFYGYLDDGRYSEMADLFVPEGAWVRLGQELRGRDAIISAMGTRKGWLTAHILTNARVSVLDECQAHTVQYITLYRLEGHEATKGPGPVVPPLGILRHADHLVLRDGQWRFLRKTSRAIMTDRSRVTHYDAERQGASSNS